MPRKPARAPAAVREPIQVYLTKVDRALLDRAARASGVSRAEVLRRGLRQYGSAVVSDANSIAAFLDEMAAGPWPEGMPNDVAKHHDKHLAEAYQSPPRRKRRKS